jgi:hypothetical protein
VPRLVTEPTRIPDPGGKVINEHVDRVNTGSEAACLAHMIVPANWDEPFQTPQFEQITLALLGSVIFDHQGGPTTAHAGQPILTGGAGYVALCLPAFAPDGVNRED